MNYLSAFNSTIKIRFFGGEEVFTDVDGYFRILNYSANQGKLAALEVLYASIKSHSMQSW